MTKHSRMKRQRIRGGAREARARDALGRKIIIKYYAGIKRETRIILKHSIYTARIILRKAAIFHMAARGRPLTGYRNPGYFYFYFYILYDLEQYSIHTAIN